MTLGGTATKVPAGAVTRSRSGPMPEGQLALQHVERVRVLPVDVRLGTALGRPEVRPRDIEQVVREEQPDCVIGVVADGFALTGR